MVKLLHHTLDADLRATCMDDEQRLILAMQQDWHFYPANHYSNRLPTIAPREEQALHAAYHNFSLSSIAEVPRTRLPPRSRSGCWTCRMRKVKCDEGRPRCNQCTRLNHECDYSPKLAFKDETPKVVDKYLGSNSPLDSWDRKYIKQCKHLLRSFEATTQLDVSRDSAPADSDDDLPPFTTLNNDDDWQRKAEYQLPGTYYVVATAESFADLEEYRTVQPPASGKEGAKGKARQPNIVVDDETLILGLFEEPPAKPVLKQDDISERCNLFISTDAAARTNQIPGPDSARSLRSVQSLQPAYTQQELEFSEPNLRYHYRSFVRRHLFRIPRDTIAASIDMDDLFEREAAFCPPLKDALMALSALSLAFQNNYQTVHALEHYTNSIKSLANLHSEQELASNGQFLTHFILLVYEIAATEGFWTHHLESLKRIVKQRREIQSLEPFPGIIWWICLVDLSVLLSASGKGDFILGELQDNSVPTSDDLRRMHPFLLSDFIRPEEWEVLAPTIDFLREITIQAAKIGELCVKIRETFKNQSHPPTRVQIAQSQQRVAQAREVLKQRWNSQVPAPLAAALGQQRLSGKARDAYEHASLTYNACMIYTHTSMWPTQRRDTEPSHYESEITYAVQAILKLANDLVGREHLQQRFAVFALLMAGMASTTQEDKTRALGLMKSFEQESMGRNTRATRKFLETIYVRQNDSLERKGNTLDVDWIELSEDLGQQIVNFGL